MRYLNGYKGKTKMKYLLLMMLVSSQAMAWEPNENPFGTYSQPQPMHIGTPTIDQNTGMYNQPICTYEQICQYGTCSMQKVCR